MKIRALLLKVCLLIFSIPILIIGVIIVFAWWTGPAHLERIMTSSPTPVARDLREILQKPTAIELVSLNTGVVSLDKTLLLNRDNPRIKNFQDDGSPLLVYAHLIRHPRRGDFLVDSGLDESFARSDSGNIKRMGRLWMALAGITFSQKAKTDLLSLLKIEKANPRAVYLTHLHLDHTTGLPALPADIKIYIGPGEAQDPFNQVDSGHLDRFETLHELDFADAVMLAPLGRALDVFGDGSFWAIHTPGHTDGHLSYLVNGESGAVLLVGDALHMQWGFNNAVGPAGGTAKRNAQAQITAERILKFSKMYPEVTIFFGHQPPRLSHSKYSFTRL